MADSLGDALVRISQTADGIQGNSNSGSPVFSPDGTKVAFWGSSHTLVPDATVGGVFLKDLTTGVLTLISRRTDGTPGHGLYPVYSPDGTRVAFVSHDTTLLDNDINGSVRDVFVKNLATGELTLVSTAADGTQKAGPSTDPAFSPDGSKIAFASAASLTLDDINPFQDIFIKDLTTGVVTLVNRTAAGVQGDDEAVDPVFSPDGSKLAFVSSAKNLLPEAPNGGIFIKDLTTGALSYVGPALVGIGFDPPSQRMAFAPDGSKLAFWSENPVPLAGGGTAAGVLVKDLSTGAVTLVSQAADGTPGNGYSERPAWSPDGSRIAFWSSADNLVPGDTNGNLDIFIKDLTTGAVTRPIDGAHVWADVPVNFPFAGPVFAPNGTHLAFSSEAALVAGDTNNRSDVFLVALGANPVPPPTNTPPTAVADAAMVQEGKAVLIDVLANDTDPDAGDSTILTGFGHNGVKGTIAIEDGKIRYTASSPDFLVLNDGETAQETFQYTMTDRKGAHSSSTVTVTILGVSDTPPPGVAKTGTNKDDTLSGTNGADTLSGQQGHDTLLGGAGADRLYGNQGKDALEGGKADDLLYGGNGDDLLLGGAGNDTLWGDHGDDTLTGGKGGDLFCVLKAAGHDVITDFDHDAGDHIGIATGTSWQVRSNKAREAVIVFSNGDEVTLQGVRANQVDAGWFAVI